MAHRQHAVELIGSAIAKFIVLPSEGVPAEDVSILRQTILNYIVGQTEDKRKGGDIAQEQFLTAVAAYHQAQWHVEAEDQDTPMMDAIPAPAEENQPSQSEANAAYAKLMQASIFGTLASRLLNHVIAAVNNPAPSLRSRALRSLNAIVDAEAAAKKPVDDAVLGNPTVRKVVSDRFLDVAVSVREAALDLVGHHIYRCALVDTQNTKAAEDYTQPILRALIDTGLSVRKRALRIAHDLYMQYRSISSTPEETTSRRQGAIDLVVAIAQRFRDEEKSAADLALKCAEAMILSGTPEETKGGTWNVRIQSPPLLAVSETTQQKRPGADEVLVPMHERVAELCGVLAQLKQTAWLVQLVRECAPKAQIKHLLQTMISWLLDRMLDKSDNIEWNCTLLNGLSEALPDLLVEHIVRLRSFLKPENGDRVILAVSEILTRSLPLLAEASVQVARPATRLLEGAEADLIAIMNRCPTHVVVPAIQCFAQLTIHVTHNHRAICDLCFKHFSRLSDAYRSVVRKNPKQKEWLQVALRLMFLTGVLCRFYDFETFAEIAYAEDANSEQQEPSKEALFYATAASSLHWRFLELYKSFFHLTAESQDEGHHDLLPTVQSTAIQAMGHIFIRSPHEMFQCKDVLEASLVPGAPEHLTQITLQTFASVLTAEEENMLNTAHRQSERLKHDDTDYNIAVLKAENADSGASASFLQHVLPRLLPLLINLNPKTRERALAVMRLLLQSGMVHPAACVSQLVALHCDPNPVLRNHARLMLAQVISKHAQYVLPGISSGVQCAWKFHLSISESKEDAPDQDLAVSQALESVYQTLQDKAFRLLFLSSLLRMFVQVQTRQPGASETAPPAPVGDDEESLLPAEMTISADERMRFLRFVCLVLARLPYTHLPELMHVAQEINRISSLSGTSSLAQLSDLSGTDLDEAAGQEEPPKLSIPKAVLRDQMHGICQSLTSLCYLLSLKHYLQESYNLTLNGLRDSKTSDKVTVRPVDDKPFSIEVPELSSATKFTSNDVLHVYRMASQMLESDSYETDLQWRSQSKVKKTSRRKSAPRETPKKTPKKRKARAMESEGSDEDGSATPASSTKRPASGRKAKRRRVTAQSSGSSDESNS
eukprot:c13893_g1_i2.p1 GENE.c13893_g1_i2~~c13893_g1_i2.p1  ORF type:complete len:1250 (+),score=256.95 c13893_g1_i2:412-3750(+)